MRRVTRVGSLLLHCHDVVNCPDNFDGRMQIVKETGRQYLMRYLPIGTIEDLKVGPRFAQIPQHTISSNFSK